MLYQLSSRISKTTPADGTSATQPTQPLRHAFGQGTIRQFLIAGVVLAFFLFAKTWAGAATDTNGDKAQMPGDSKNRFAEEYGIRVFGPYLSGGGNIVDFRYKVLDATKAVVLTKRENKPTLFNPANGAKLIIPNTPKLGSLRQMTSQPIEGKVYFMIFANTRHHVKHGDKVTITAGECKLENLIVE